MVQNLECVQELFNQRIDFVKALMDERQFINNKALELNSVEMQRRLEILNGEASRLRDMQATYLPREIYDQNLHALSEAVHKLQTDYAYVQGKGQIISALVSLGTSALVGLFIAFAGKLFH